ncbi:hypothetical protein AOQ88_01045 [Candidatus Riesia sp. GBBU]|nr:hypothetical protein AOQ88_01045 [Candidatus Riesia sp. GBBU]
MDYCPFSIKWRPKKFSDLIGQDHILIALKNSLKKKRIHNAYLFSGAKGTGKTTIARIFSKGISCENGVTENPCNSCKNCIDIENGNFIDLVEVDAASRTRVEDTNELLENVQYTPSIGIFKIYLIDEIHMFSKHSFNALLKTIEEPPKYVKFLFATTEPKKIPDTILSRCLHFHLKTIDQREIYKKIKNILSHEKIKSDSKSLKLISKISNGSMRDALNLIEQSLLIGNGNDLYYTKELISEFTEEEKLIKLIENIINKNVEKVLKLLDEISDTGIEWEIFLDNLLSAIHKIIVFQLVPRKDNISLPKEKIEKKLYELSFILKHDEAQYYYNSFLKCKKNLAFAPTKRIGVEVSTLFAIKNNL